MSQADLHVGLLGASRVATYAVLEPARIIPGIQVQGIAARDPNRARRYAADHSIGRAYASYDELLHDAGIDLVYIGTPPACHVEQALSAIAAGKPVLVEKPFARDAAGAARVLDAAREAGVLVFEAMHSPHHALFGRVLSLVADGRIGKLQHVDALFDAPIPADDPIRWSGALGGGALMDLGVYPLAWVRRLCGEQFAIEAADVCMRGDADASFTARLRFGDGLTANVSSSMISGQRAARMTVTGDCGQIVVDNPVAPQLGHRLTIINSGGTSSETVAGPSTYEAQLAAVRDAVTGEVPFPFPADDFVRSMEAIDRVREAWSWRADQ